MLNNINFRISCSLNNKNALAQLLCDYQEKKLLKREFRRRIACKAANMNRAETGDRIEWAKLSLAFIAGDEVSRDMV